MKAYLDGEDSYWSYSLKNNNDIVEIESKAKSDNAGIAAIIFTFTVMSIMTGLSIYTAWQVAYGQTTTNEPPPPKFVPNGNEPPTQYDYNGKIYQLPQQQQNPFYAMDNKTQLDIARCLVENIHYKKDWSDQTFADKLYKVALRCATDIYVEQHPKPFGTFEK